MKKGIYIWIIIREWKECGEFRGIHRIVIVEDHDCAWITSFLCKGENRKVFLCSREFFLRRYKQLKGVKWIVPQGIIKRSGEHGPDIIKLPRL